MGIFTKEDFKSLIGNIVVGVIFLVFFIDVLDVVTWLDDHGYTTPGTFTDEYITSLVVSVCTFEFFLGYFKRREDFKKKK